ncbi:isochorismatase family protein [Streptomyces carpinensis]|uniref:isochorismatase family protein n=1 Tax=Streptomyces carpinensis TaxID=66369 RepID=UPI001302B805|nr:isochorismatase family protein [Streptomyces carpinensis]
MTALGDVEDREACATVWAVLTDDERTVYEKAGYHRTFGLGSTPALLVVDVEYNFTGLPGDTAVGSVENFPDSCGPAAWRAIPRIVSLLEIARALALPVVFTTGRPNPASDRRPRVGTDVVDELRPHSDELVLAKAAASPFHATGLVDHLRGLGVDTVVHTGCVTSGCVRAGVVDAAAHGFSNAVIEECVFDRAVLPHQLSLFDMDAKYADVMCLDAITRYLTALPT